MCGTGRRFSTSRKLDVHESVLIIVFVMVYLDILFTSRMHFFREFGPKHKEYSSKLGNWGGEEHGGRKGAKEGGADPGNKHKVSPTSRPREPPRAS